MKLSRPLRLRPTTLAVMLALGSSTGVYAADADSDAGVRELSKIEVTGSRIKRADIEGESAILTISREDLDRTGYTSVGEILQALSVTGSALNTKFNSSGNFGFPASGAGIGAGTTQVNMRHLGPQRTLVLVNGLRWINETSASGVSSATDLNTIPLNMVERIEVLLDGASSVYGSDAIAGVVNIITVKDFDGLAANAYYGQFDDGDGETE
ncbi:MAG: TonB-dependent receptor plug domain-containing protein, partial [Gammaproteobacteria bacterium]